MKIYVVEKIEIKKGIVKLLFAKSPPSELARYLPVDKYYKNSLHIEHTYSLVEVIKLFNSVNSKQSKIVVDISTDKCECIYKYDTDSVWKHVHKNPLPIKKVGDLKDEVSLRTRK